MNAWMGEREQVQVPDEVIQLGCGKEERRPDLYDSFIYQQTRVSEQQYKEVQDTVHIVKNIHSSKEMNFSVSPGNY